MNTEVITVATHKEGTLDELINNKHNINVNVLGFGEKWTGFKMKYELMYDYLKNQPDNKIIVFIDGFDSKIEGKLEEAKRRFLRMNCKVLVSQEAPINIYLKKQIFGTCEDEFIANSGLYMGYAKYIKIILKECLKETCKDDQVVLNRKCKKFSFIKVDKKNEIFENIRMIRIGESIEDKSGNKKKRAIFTQIPGTLSYARLSRSFFEYIQFLLLPFFLIILLLCSYFYRKKSYLSLYFALIITFCLLCKSDYSCLK